MVKQGFAMPFNSGYMGTNTPIINKSWKPEQAIHLAIKNIPALCCGVFREVWDQWCLNRKLPKQMFHHFMQILSPSKYLKTTIMTNPPRMVRTIRDIKTSSQRWRLTHHDIPNWATPISGGPNMKLHITKNRNPTTISGRFPPRNLSLPEK